MKLFEDVKKETDIIEMVKKATDILTKTEIILNENVIAYYDNEDWYFEENAFKKFLEYKNIKGFYGKMDCDVSIMCIAMYILLNPKLDNKVEQQMGSSKKYQIIVDDIYCKGDTLTSAIISIKKYLGCLWKEIDEHKEKYCGGRYDDFYKLFNGMSSNYGIPIAGEGKWNDWCQKNSEIIWSVMSRPAKDFLRHYFDFGNYMCIPGKSYKISEGNYTSFNMSRSYFGNKDTIDTLLCGFYNYFKCVEAGKDGTQYLEWLFKAKSAEITEETIKWLDKMDMNTWENFLAKNCLEDFVDMDSLIPISLKTGKSINIKNICKYSALPNNLTEYDMFFSQLVSRIVLRNVRIYNKIRDGHK